MSTPEARRRGRAALVALSLAAAGATAWPQAAPRLGEPLAPTAAAGRSLNVFPDGRGLPPGQGTAAQGAALYARHCAACHGARGEGGPGGELAGASEPLDSEYPDKTVGQYWPHATTLFDHIRRAMPPGAPGRFSADELYALSAWVLWANGLVGEQDVLDARSLPRVRMPNRQGFRGVDAVAPE